MPFEAIHESIQNPDLKRNDGYIGTVPQQIESVMHRIGDYMVRAVLGKKHVKESERSLRALPDLPAQ